MILPDLLGFVLDIAGRRCRLLTVTERAHNGRAALVLATVAAENPDGSERLGVVPMIATPGPGTLPPAILFPSPTFDEAGDFREFPRPITEHIRNLAWSDADGGRYSTAGDGWPRPDRQLSEADRIHALLDTPPLLTATEERIGGRLVRLVGVPMVNPDGSARDPAAILVDARARRAELSRERVKGDALRPHIRRLEELIAELEELIAQGGGA